MRALGINIFGGGFTRGVIDAGFEVLEQWEESGDIHRRTFDANFAGKIRRVVGRGNWNMLDVEPHLVYANPPCAPWSAASVRPGGVDDDRLAMTRQTME